MKLSDVAIPSSEATRAAGEIAERYYSPALLNHCLRSYYFAAAAALVQDLPHDPELLYVASLLHDLGLVDPFDAHTMPFEMAGGHVAWVFAAGAGWTTQRRDRLAEVIVNHMGDAVDPAVDAESHLLEIATALDIVGRDSAQWPEPLLAEVLDAFPRLDLADEFADCFDRQAARKPTSAAAASVRGGIGTRLAAWSGVTPER